jgi:formyltetrahydrofolate deformylase
VGCSILKLSCPDRVGLLSEASSIFASRGSNLTEVNQHTDTENGWFFLRMEFDSLEGPDSAALLSEISVLSASLGAEWSIRNKSEKYRLAIMCSKDGHCLSDLIWRWKSGSLPFDLAGVISNHPDLREVVEREGAPFVEISMDGDKRIAFESVRRQVSDWGATVIVLARFMQIIPPWLCQEWQSRAINIHHSFLPAFPGASPYRQAYQKGVKIIGATCHYVTSDLDEGPIIEQEVLRVSHFHKLEDLIQVGQDCERLALYRGLLYHLEDRVFCHNGKTVVFAG